MKKIISTESDMLAFAADIARAVKSVDCFVAQDAPRNDDPAQKTIYAPKLEKSGIVIFLSGPLGAGKTTFTRGFLRELGYTGKVKSPSYTLVEPYELQGKIVNHFDFYRLQDAKELEHIGIRDYFSETAICLIEWPEKGQPFLPEPDLFCTLSFVGTSREVNVEAHSACGNALLQVLR